MKQQKVALITGISSGIGQATAILLAEQGFQVFGTVRKPNDSQSNISVLPLDVQKDESVQNCVDAVLAQAGRVDVLVNNAGFAVIGAIEESSLPQAQALFETNFFGVVRMTKAVLPIMRSQRQGRLINLSSVVGFLPAPYMGFYAASKHALEGYTESLDHEVRKFGIRAVLIEPGFIRTQIGQNTQPADSPIAAYRVLSLHMVELINQQVLNGENPAVVARKILQAVNSTSPRLRYAVGREAVLLNLLRKFMPAGLLDRSLRKQFQLDLDT
jgi:NAD(P)-dependent dehydrogenase (short-subunit alcohol dehydrogenase family)